MATKYIPIFLPHDRVAWIMAGPTRELPDDYLLIRCAAEIPVPKSKVFVDVSTEDFRPFDDETVRDALPSIIGALNNGVKLYVGCMGGTGRTGTMLAVLAGQHPGLSGIEAITYIRQVYKSGAVETAEQEHQVIRLSVPRELNPAVEALGYYEDAKAESMGLWARLRRRFSFG